MSKEEKPVTGAVVAITGGCGGIGRATAQSLAARGARVALGDLDGDEAQRVAAELGPGHFGGFVDVTDTASFTAFLDAAEDELGPLDVLVNNAGVMLLSPLEDESDESTEKSLQINLFGVISGTRLAIRRMRPRGRGQIINIASQAGKVGFPGGATYCATKFGVVGLCEATRNELKGSGILVTCVMPGPVRTELAAGIGQAKGVRWLSPFEVGEGIAKAIATGQSEVWLPPITRFLQPPTSVLPPKLRDRMLKAFGADAVLSSSVDRSQRAEYEERSLK